MIVCSVKRGFFNLRDCGALAVNACSLCHRPICQEHSTLQGASVICLDCHARQAEGALPPQQAYDSSWTYSTRHRYYESGSYSPVYWGSHYDHYYDTYDIRSFDRQESEPQPEEEQGGVDFFDS